MPFGQTELSQYLVSHNITGSAASYIRAASHGLSRDVRPSGYASCVVEFQSTKMQSTVNCESRTAEHVYALGIEYDEQVLAYYEQAPEVDVRRLTKSGYRRTVSYHPDFLLLRVDGPEVVQIKPLTKLLELVESSKDWTRGPDGEFQDVPAQDALAAKGLRHVVVPIDAAEGQRAANITLLLGALRLSETNDDIVRRAESYIARRDLLPLAELASALGVTDYAPLLRMIADHRLYTDIGQFSLAHPETCLVARRPDMLSKPFIEGWRGLRAEYELRCTNPTSQARLPLEKHLQKAQEAIQQLNAGRNDRTARRWKAKVQSAKAEGTCAMVALAREYMSRGNRSPKRPRQIAFATEYVTANWGSSQRPSRSSLYRSFKLAVESSLPELQPLSRASFYKLIERLTPSLAYARGGNRAHNAATQPTDVKLRALQPQRPFELATCDHHLCDQYCTVLDANGMKYAMKPWLTILRDVATGSVLAHWLRLSAPSKRSVALVIRQCVRLHGRLPEGIVEDNGSDFASVYNSALAAHCGFNLVFRPVGHPRYGSEAERFFGQYKDLWLATRAGNVVNVGEVRSVSASHRPEKMATMTLLDFWDDLSSFCGWMEQHTTESSLSSPATRMREGLARFSCSGIRVVCDDEFLIATSVDDGTYKFDPRRGLHIGAFHYWSPELASTSKSKVPVRLDPEDPYKVYALVNHKWVACLASRAVSYAMQSPLHRAVEGSIQLDRAELNRKIRSDGDRLLAQAIQSRGSGTTAREPKVTSREKVAAVTSLSVDLFADVALQGDLPDLLEASW